MEKNEERIKEKEKKNSVKKNINLLKSLKIKIKIFNYFTPMINKLIDLFISFYNYRNIFIK
jgi:hypothetical protein